MDNERPRALRTIYRARAGSIPCRMRQKRSKKERRTALEGSKSADYDQNDGNLLRPARSPQETAEQCFAPDSRANLTTHSAVLALCANITSSASGLNSMSDARESEPTGERGKTVDNRFAEANSTKQGVEGASVSSDTRRLCDLSEEPSIPEIYSLLFSSSEYICSTRTEL